MFMLHKDTPGLKIDSETWRPTGMRACVSPWLYMENCFVPEENLFGQPGQFLGENWMGKINFAFTANYLRRGAGDVRLGAQAILAIATAAKTATANCASAS